MTYFCCDIKRRNLVRLDPTLNGIDRVEVVDRELLATPNQHLRQRQLRLFWVKDPADPLKSAITQLVPNDIDILVGDGPSGILVTLIHVETDHLLLTLNRSGDFSTHTLAFKKSLPNLDPRLSRVDFSFKVECPSDLDCQPACECPPSPLPQPEIDYLAKDYASFRQLLLDRLAITTPGWIERNAADLGITLVEILAYVGDYLSYRQDAHATEAYLETALHRPSVRRHARLLDYRMHDGANARAWVQVRLKPGASPRSLYAAIPPQSADAWPTPVRFLTGNSDQPLNDLTFRQAVESGTFEVFEPLPNPTDPITTLHAEHNEMEFHTWGDEDCCLPKGATRATLKGAFPSLAPGFVLVFVEKRDPQTGLDADADMTHRHAVRLTHVQPAKDPLADAGSVDVTEIAWAAADALPFPLCLSTVARNGSPPLSAAVALGNIVLADHGLTVLPKDPKGEPLGAVPQPNPALAAAISSSCNHCDDTPPDGAPPRFRPMLQRTPITQAAPWTHDRPASLALLSDPAQALPAVELRDGSSRLWKPQRDLLASASFSPEFVLETQNDGRGVIRFGDDENGQRPAVGESFHAAYRIGNGTRGNLGADSLRRAYVPHHPNDTHALSAEDIESVSNPLPAQGGAEPESLEEVRQYAPQAFRVPRRCVTPDDYAARAAQHPEVQRAAATLRWTGSWHSIFLTVDRRDGRPVDETFEHQLLRFLEPFRLAGHDLEIDGPLFVPLELKLTACVRPGYFRADIRAALLNAFTHRTRPDGSRGFFHPDNFTFGQSVYTSAILAVAQAVPGVEHVEVSVLQRLGTTPDSRPITGELKAGRLEILRLDQDPSFPGRGRLTLELKGGR